MYRSFLGVSSIAGSLTCCSAFALEEKGRYSAEVPPIPFKFPKRQDLISRLKQEEPFDVLVIGGGATGCGVAYEAASRGRSVALVERGDFASGTSSKSTKLIHGGIRYLQKAVTRLDRDEYHLVKESLEERKLLLQNAPHIVRPVPIMIPVFSYFDAVLTFCGLKLYDWISKDPRMRSQFLSVAKARELFPYIDASKLKCAFLYYDGQQNDSRMNLSVIKTAITKGAVSCNYVQVERLIKNGDRVESAVLRDNLTGETFQCRAKCFVNATGPYTDLARHLYDPTAQTICQPSSGAHMTFSKELTKNNVGLLIYEEENRVLFVLPWQGQTLVGTSDTPSKVVSRVKPTPEEIQYILKKFGNFLQDKSMATPSHVESCWAGLRPLVLDPSSSNGSSNTVSLSRGHLIESDQNFVTITGGKWTIFRLMGVDTMNVVDPILQHNTGNPNSSHNFSLFDGQGWSETFYQSLVSEYGIDPLTAQHLSTTYGTCAKEIAEIIRAGSKPNTGILLHPDFPFTEEEIVYICRNEYACKLEDVIARRTPLALLNTNAAAMVIPRIAEIMSSELGWSESQTEREMTDSFKFLDEDMGRSALKELTLSQ